MAHEVFISHSYKDKLTADAVCHALEENGIRCWIAPRDILSNGTYGAQIIRAIKECPVMLLIFSKNANASEDVANEVQNAFKRNKPIIPYRLDETEMSDELEYFLSRKHWIDAYPDDTVFDELVRTAMKTLGRNAGGERAGQTATAPSASYAPSALRQTHDIEKTNLAQAAQRIIAKGGPTGHAEAIVVHNYGDQTTKTKTVEKNIAASLPANTMPHDAEDFCVEDLAMYIHSQYRSTQPGGSYDMPWESLPESIKEANRDQARDTLSLLEMMGYGFDAGETPFPSIDCFTAEEIEYFSRHMHEDWLNEKLASGWVYGPVKDANAIPPTHPCILPWEELPESDKEKDRDVARGYIPLLNSAGLRVYRKVLFQGMWCTF